MPGPRMLVGSNTRLLPAISPRPASGRKVRRRGVEGASVRLRAGLMSAQDLRRAGAGAHPPVRPADGTTAIDTRLGRSGLRRCRRSRRACRRRLRARPRWGTRGSARWVRGGRRGRRGIVRSGGWGPFQLGQEVQGLHQGAGFFEALQAEVVGQSRTGCQWAYLPGDLPRRPRKPVRGASWRWGAVPDGLVTGLPATETRKSGRARPCQGDFTALIMVYPILSRHRARMLG